MNEQKLLGFQARFITGQTRTSRAITWLRRYLEDVAAFDKKHRPHDLPARLQKASAKAIAESYLERLSQPVSKQVLGLDRGFFRRWQKDVKSRQARKHGAMGGRPTYQSKSERLIAEVISTGRKVS